MRLLVVEDDDRLSGLLRRGLRAQGFAVDDAATVEDAHWMAMENDYDALVLDVGLPDGDGFGLCADLRTAGRWMPILMAARYHSLAVDPATLPSVLRVTAMSEVDRVIMGIRHVALPMEGVQFHPESVLTPQGPHLLANFLRLAGEGEAARLDAATGSFATAGLATSAVAGEEEPR